MTNMELPIFPISFSIPSEKIVEKVPQKKKFIAQIIPGDKKTYIFENERDYYQDYQISYFAHTKKKSGYDCLRHLEILANGCIPIFEDIEEIPEKTMVHYPKNLLNAIYSENLVKKLDTEKYSFYAEKLLNFTKTNLTCLSMAKYILQKTNHEKVKKILYISYGGPDYLRCLTLIGFKKLLGKNCVDFPNVNHIYEDYSGDVKKLYGSGISYSKIIEEDNRISFSPIQLYSLISRHYFDIVIYGSINRCSLFMNLVKKVYLSNEIILLSGEDINTPCILNNFPHNYKFKRELS